MDNTVNNISQNYYQIEVQVQAQEDIPKTSNEKTENPTQVNTTTTETDNGQTDQVEITSKSSETVAANHTVPEDHDEAVELREDTKERIYEENAIQSQDPEQIHNPNPGDIVEILAQNLE